ncbi:hypothetical protein [Aeoliella mucimassa]|uniref:DUF1570 domain-containing protein n=1 Tax=Aeoliella mucimassa TaxID=2527972 RepID=A0A518AJG2_9BACT|nr:hypothetical protein [Aeoliella mucimassa]QDU54862.1 hypothetical protein Pan181_10460 [Aeoliella mucimassa]
MLYLLSSHGALAQNIGPRRQAAIDQWPAVRPIDKSQLVRQGFRVLEGKHITLVTDLPSSVVVDELPTVVDAAVPLLAERFQVDDRRVRDWHVLAMLIGHREKFDAAGLMPRGNEEFPNGLSIGYELWVNDQSSDYYRRHLLVHEVVHSFMATQLGACGPAWYMEGMAELLGTHRWDSQTGKLEIGVMPTDRNAVPMWGRTKLVRDAIDEHRMLPIVSVLKIDNSKPMGVESYAWVWSLAKFLDAHPRYSERFRRLQSHTLDPEFDQRFFKTYAADWSDLETEWRVFTAGLDYNYDVAREAIEFPQNRSQLQSLDTPSRVQVAADRGWQATNLVLEAGRTYELKAGGRFVIGAEPDGTPWTCEPGGITLSYHAGQPLGKLLAVVDPRPIGDGSASATSAFVTPTPVGLSGQLAPSQSGVLYLRLNDSPGELGDNHGDATVSIRRLPR